MGSGSVGWMDVCFCLFLLFGNNGNRIGLGEQQCPCHFNAIIKSFYASFSSLQCLPLNAIVKSHPTSHHAFVPNLTHPTSQPAIPTSPTPASLSSPFRPSHPTASTGLVPSSTIHALKPSFAASSAVAATQ